MAADETRPNGQGGARGEVAVDVFVRYCPPKRTFPGFLESLRSSSKLIISLSLVETCIFLFYSRFVALLRRYDIAG